MPAFRIIAALTACLALTACSATTDTPAYGPPTITAASSFVEQPAPGAAMLVSGSRWLLMDDVLRECTVAFTPPEPASAPYEARVGACSHEMIHIAGWRTAGDTLDLFNAEGEVVGRLTVETPNLLRGKFTVLNGQQVDATLNRL